MAKSSKPEVRVGDYFMPVGGGRPYRVVATDVGGFVALVNRMRDVRYVDERVLLDRWVMAPRQMSVQ